jgi:phasin family protein
MTTSKNKSATSAVEAANSASTSPAALTNAAANDAFAAVSQLTKSTQPVLQTATDLFKANAKTLTGSYEQAFTSTQQQIEKANNTMIEKFDDYNNFAKDNINATVQAMNILAKGYEDILKQCFSFAQSCMENNLAAIKELTLCKNAQEAFELQSKLAKNNIDSFISESSKISEASINCANKAFEPIQKRVDTAFDKASKKAA